MSNMSAIVKIQYATSIYNFHTLDTEHLGGRCNPTLECHPPQTHFHTFSVNLDETY